MKQKAFHLRVLSAEGTVVLGVLGDFHLLDDLTEGSTISGSVLSANSDLLGVVALLSTTTTSIREAQQTSPQQSQRSYHCDKDV